VEECVTLKVQIDIGGAEMLGIGLPFSPGDLQELVRLAEVDWDSFSDDFSPEANSTEPAGPTEPAVEEDGDCIIVAKLSGLYAGQLAEVEDSLGLDKTQPDSTYWGEFVARLLQAYSTLQILQAKD
jgi:hypothetical protein